MNFHPTNEAFWWPLAWAIPGGLFGVALGWATTGYLDGGVILGAIFAFATWVIVSFFWLGVVWRSYGPVQRPEPIQHPSDADVLPEFDPAWIEVHCVATPQDTHVLHDLPIEFSDLFIFSNGIMRDNKTTVYSEWVGSKAAGKLFSYQQDYETLIAWFARWGYGALNKRNTLEMTEKGRDLLEDILHQDFSHFSPTEIEDRAKLYISHPTRLGS